MVFFCTGTDRLHHMTDRAFIYDRCTQCEAVLMRQMPAQQDIQALYPTEYAAYQPATDIRDWSTLDSLPVRGHAVEIGCGPGNALASFARFRPEWTLEGVDFSAEAMTIARKQLPRASLAHGDLIEWITQAPSAQYDLVICEHVIEHVEDPQVLFDHLARICAPHGIILLSIPNAGSLTMRLFRAKAFHLETPRHLYIPSHRSIVQMVTRAQMRLRLFEGQAYPSVLLRSGGKVFQRCCRWMARMRAPGIITRLLRPFRHHVPFLFSKVTYVISTK